MRSSGPWVLAFAAMSSGLAVPASFAQTLNWERSNPSTAPSRRADQSMAYDAERRRVVIFAGYQEGGLLGDTWTWDGTTWRQEHPANSPPPRADHPMVYDAVRRNTVLFGGRDASGYLSDTWTWNGVDWHRLSPSVLPSARDDHAMAYDAARAQVVLFGGFDGRVTLADTWVWDGNTWARRQPRTSPSPRYGHAMAFDEANGVVVLFGGWTGSNTLADTWTWDGNVWEQRSPANSPSPRVRHAMAYDAAHRRVILFAGGPFVHNGRTWTWDGSDWTRVSTPEPADRTHHDVAYDSARQEVVLFGGYQDGNPVRFDDTWTFGPIGFSTYGDSCGSPPAASLSPRSDPIVGGSLTIETWNAAPTASQGFLAFGISRWNIDLSIIGMPGCWLLQSHEDTKPFSIGQGTGQVTLSVPNDPNLVGLVVFVQAVILDPGANPTGVLTTHGGSVTVRR